MSTVRDLIKGSLRLIGAVASGETPSADEQAEALLTLNDMLDSWSLESLIIYVKTREEFALVSNKQTYTFGVGGDFSSARPVTILQAGLVISGTNPIEIPVEILNLEQWRDITVKSTASTFPSKLYPEFSFPLSTLNFWPIPTAVNNVALYSEKALTSFLSASDAINLPPGYKKALKYNLAVELAPEFGKTIDPAVLQMALDSKENVKRKNVKLAYLKSDAGLLRQRTFNWRTGE